MARLIASANGDASGSIWSPCVDDANAELDSETQSSSPGTSAGTNTDSASFTPAAEEVDGVAIKLSVNSQTVGVTLTVTLRNTTTGTDVGSVTVNASDLPICSSNSDRSGGWQFFKFGSPHTPNGTDTYVVRVVLSTGTSIQLWRDSTAANWSRLIRRTATQTWAAADRLVVTGELTGAGSRTDRTVTWDYTGSDIIGNSTGISTAAFSTGVGGVNAALVVGSGGTLQWANSASTNYKMNVTGPICIYNGGTWKRGTSSSPIPRSSTATVTFTMSASSDSGIAVYAGATFDEEGESRSSGKNIIQTLLAADASASATSVTTEDDTGWLPGDQITLASTTRTQSQTETKTIDTVSGTTINLTTGLTSAHGGADGVQAEVVLLTHNVMWTSDNASRFIKYLWGGAGSLSCSVSCRWVGFNRWGGGNSSTDINNSTTRFAFQYCSFSEITTGTAFQFSQTANAFSIQDVVFVGAVNTTVFSTSASNTQVPTWVIKNVTYLSSNGGSFTIGTSHSFGELHHLRVVCASFTISSQGSTIGGPTVRSDFGNFVCHSGGTFTLTITPREDTWIDGVVCYRFSSVGLQINGQSTGGRLAVYKFKNLVIFGNVTANLLTSNGHMVDITLLNPTIAGDTSFSTATGIQLTGSSGGAPTSARLRILGGVLGGGGGTKTTHTQDILIGSNSAGSTLVADVQVIGTSLLSSTEVSLGSALFAPSRYSYQGVDDSLANTRTVFVQQGTVAYETTTVHSPDTVSEKLTPNTIDGQILRSSPVRVNVNSSDEPTVSVWVRRNSSYNGSFEPRLVLRANPAVGINEDVVLDSLSAGADTWEELSGTIDPATAAGKLELCVECDGTAGDVFVGSWSRA